MGPVNAMPQLESQIDAVTGDRHALERVRHYAVEAAGPVSRGGCFSVRCLNQGSENPAVST